MSIITRFAPSPTGMLHVGNIRTAMINWFSARNSVDGKFILRIDDTDVERSRAEYEHAIEYDLKWLGLNWDIKYKQSENIERYDAAMQQLIASGRLYPCYETQEELAIKRKVLLQQHKPPIYDRSALALTTTQRELLEANDIKPHWRFMLKDEKISWCDKICGDMLFDGRHLTDPVLVKADGCYTYTLASVVDDIALGITLIARGEDHLSNSATQIQLFNALGAKFIPDMAHLPLLYNKEKEISKRIGGFSITDLRDAGIDRMTILSFLAKIGTSDAIECYESIDKLLSEFDLRKFGRCGVHYDDVDLLRLNAKFMRQMSYDLAKKLLNSWMDAHATDTSISRLPMITEEFWDMIRANVNIVVDAIKWWKICKQTSLDPIENTEAQTHKNDVSSIIKIAANTLPEWPWTEDKWMLWTAAMKSQIGKLDRCVFHAIRVALTGLEDGPELKKLLLFMDRDTVLDRLAIKT